MDWCYAHSSRFGLPASADDLGKSAKTTDPLHNLGQIILESQLGIIFDKLAAACFFTTMTLFFLKTIAALFNNMTDQPDDSGLTGSKPGSCCS